MSRFHRLTTHDHMVARSPSDRVASLGSNPPLIGPLRGGGGIPFGLIIGDVRSRTLGCNESIIGVCR